MVRPAGLLLLLAMLAFTLPVYSQAQQRIFPAASPDPYAAVSHWTLGLVSSTLNGTSLRMANDMAVALNDEPNLRIVPIIGENAIRNVTDLFYLNGADIAIVHSDVLSYLRRTRRMPGNEDRIQYIAKLAAEEFHVLAAKKFAQLADLGGRKVSFGPAGSGSALTAEVVFETSKVQVQPQYLDQTVALERLRTGELDAIVFVSGKPSTAFDHIRSTDGLHFLDVQFVNDLQRDYLPATLTHDDYPELIVPNQMVKTIAVNAVMVVQASPAKSERYLKLTRFVEAFFSKVETLRRRPSHAKWQEVSLSAPVEGWIRFPPAQQWLKEHPESVVASGNVFVDKNGDAGLQTVAGVSALEAKKLRLLFDNISGQYGPVSGEDREKLFDEFLRWYSAKTRN